MSYGNTTISDDYNQEWRDYNVSMMDGGGGGGPGGPSQTMIRAIYGIFGTIFTIGVLGNLLVITAASRRLQGMHKTMSVFITNLSVADMLFLVFCMPFSATIFTLPSWIFGNFMCKFATFSMYASMFASIYTLVLMSLDRYIAVVYPLRFFNLRSLRHSVWATIVIWLLSFGFSSPYLYVLGTVTEQYPTHSETYCVEQWNDIFTQRPRYHLFVFLVGYALPLIIIISAYMRILCVLWKKFQPTDDGSQNNISKSKKKVSVMVCVVVSAFGICWLPHHVISLWIGFGHFEFTMATMIAKLFALCLSSVNSCLNPIIYSIMSDNFRNSLMKAIRYVFWKRERNSMMSRHNRLLLNRPRFNHQYRHHHYYNPPINKQRRDGTKQTEMASSFRGGSKTTTGVPMSLNKQNGTCAPIRQCVSSAV